MFMDECGFSMASWFLGNGATAWIGGVDVEGVASGGGGGSVCVCFVQVSGFTGMSTSIWSVCVAVSVVVVILVVSGRGLTSDSKKVLTLSGSVVLVLIPSRSSVRFSKIFSEWLRKFSSHGMWSWVSRSSIF